MENNNFGGNFENNFSNQEMDCPPLLFRVLNILVATLTACCSSIRFFGFKVLSSSRFILELPAGNAIDDPFAMRQHDGKRVLALVEASPEISEDVKFQFRLTLGAPEIRKYILFPGDVRKLHYLLRNRNIFERISSFHYDSGMILSCKHIFSLSFGLVNRIHDFFETACLTRLTHRDLILKFYILNAWFRAKNSKVVQFSMIHVLFKILMTSSCGVHALSYEGETTTNFQFAFDLCKSYVQYFTKICPSFVAASAGGGGEAIG